MLAFLSKSPISYDIDNFHNAEGEGTVNWIDDEKKISMLHHIFVINFNLLKKRFSVEC